ncbi:MAG: DUF4870 domain-containing protein [Planctomycetes bacterium]|nr:DUF4870 domain-containing protein [Planctomycetota bacterium]
MPDTTTPTPPPEPAPTPFGAGIPAVPVEPVRLAAGSAPGPALEVRGRAAESEPSVPTAGGGHARPPGEPGAPLGTPPGAKPCASDAPVPPPPPGPPPASEPAVPPAARPRGRAWIALAHLLFLIPFPPGVLLTALLWIWRRARDPLMRDQGREALNMQLTFWLAIGLLGATCVSTPLVPFAYVLGAVLCVLAAIAAWGGDQHRYPWVFRFLV